MTAISGIRASLVHVRPLATYVHRPVRVEQRIVEAKIQKLIETEDIKGISEYINSEIIPYDSDSTEGFLARPVNQNDFILACIPPGNLKMVRKLTGERLGATPERLVRDENHIYARLVGSNKSDALLSAIFWNQWPIVDHILKCKEYTLTKNYNFPLRTLSRRVEKIKTYEPCKAEISPLTVALMMPTTMEDTKSKVRMLLNLGAEKTILPFSHACHFDNAADLEIFNRRLADYRQNYETFLQKCF